jgi:hypothetical protein
MDHNATSSNQTRQTWDSLASTIKKKTAVKKTSPRQGEAKVDFTCDLSTMPMFSTNFSAAAPVPVISAYGIDPAHRYYMRSRNWDYDRIIHDKKSQVCRSDRSAATTGTRWRDLIIEEENNVFIHLEEGDLSVYAPDVDTAKHVAINFSDKYSMPEKANSGCYNLLSVSNEGIDTESVPLQERNKLDEEKMDLFYGDGFRIPRLPPKATLWPRYFRGDARHRKNLLHPLPHRETQGNPPLLFHTARLDSRSHKSRVYPILVSPKFDLQQLSFRLRA